MLNVAFYFLGADIICSFVTATVDVDLNTIISYQH